MTFKGTSKALPKAGCDAKEWHHSSNVTAKRPTKKDWTKLTLCGGLWSGDASRFAFVSAHAKFSCRHDNHLRTELTFFEMIHWPQSSVFVCETEVAEDAFRAIDRSFILEAGGKDGSAPGPFPLSAKAI